MRLQCNLTFTLPYYYRLHNLVTSRQQDKLNLAALEKKLQDERKFRTAVETQLSQERKAKKVEDAANARAVAMQRFVSKQFFCCLKEKNYMADAQNFFKECLFSSYALHSNRVLSEL